jgi:oligoribonuclease NrnB/cAMP/cGMP phosphodiesterase (DHH superfamily)
MYHANCIDGFCAAWIVKKFLPEAELIPQAYGCEPPDVTGANVFVVDFSYPRTVMKEMRQCAASLVVLDHHKTAQKELEGLPFAKFDMNQSGCGMTWNHFGATRAPFGGKPWFIDYIEDRDLWRFALPGSKAINAFLGVQELTVENFDTLTITSSTTAEHCGAQLLKLIDRYVRDTAKNARIIEAHGPLFEKWKIALVNAPYTHCSELGDHLAKTLPVDFVVIWFERSDGKFAYSLRSRSDFDVSEVAKLHGGGGHAQAAGFSAPCDPNVVFGKTTTLLMVSLGK